MRIGIITQSYYPIKGGVAEHVHATAAELRKRGHTVTIITAYFNRGDEEWSDGVERIGRDLTLPFNGAFVNITVGMRLKHDLLALERKYRFDVVHVHNPLDPVLPIIAVLDMHAPKIGTFHTYKPSSIAYRIMQGPLERRLNRVLHTRIAVSEAAKTFFGKYISGPWEIVPNGVAIDRFREDVPPMPQFADGKPNILFVGRMDPRKGVSIALGAFMRVADQIPEARLLIVGGGILLHHYRRFIPTMLAPRVHFLNYVSMEDLPRWYATADVCCFPAYGRESFGIVLAEAMAAGKPIVASDIVGYRSVVDDGVNGLLARAGEPQDFADKLRYILAHPEEAGRMGAAGRAKAESTYAWPRIVDRLEQICRKAIADA